MNVQRIAVLLIATLGAALAAAQTQDPPRMLVPVLDDYVRVGLDSNLALQQEQISYAASIEALAEARGALLPSVSLEARDTRAVGGRSLDIPVGSLVNPIYATLNSLTASMSQPTHFAPLQDQQFDIQRTREQVTAVRISQPLYAPKITSNVRRQKAATEAAQYSREAFEATLVRDIRIAYFDWSKAGQALAIVESNILSLTENLRVNRSLFAAGKVTEDQVLRAEAELLAVEQQRVEAQNRIQAARRYFNFLLNRPHDQPIEAATYPDTSLLAPKPLETLKSASLERRAEIKALAAERAAAAAAIDTARADFKPTIALALEGGTQGEGYSTSHEDRYAIGSIVFSWSIFSGNQTRARVNQAQLAAKASEVRLDQEREQIGLEVEQAHEDLIAAMKSLDSAAARERAAAAAFKIAVKKRDAGVISQAEFLDSRTSLADAQSNFNVVRFDAFAKATELSYAAGFPASGAEDSR